MIKKILKHKTKSSFLIISILITILLALFLKEPRSVSGQKISVGDAVKRGLDGIDKFQKLQDKPVPGTPVEFLKAISIPYIPTNFFEKDRYKVWITVDCHPEETELMPPLNYAEDSCITLRAWNAIINPYSGKYEIGLAGIYNRDIYVFDLSEPKIYDGENGATNLKEPKKFSSWHEGEMTICLTSLHYRYASQKSAKIKVYSKDEITNLYQEGLMLQVKQWVDYRAIVQRKDNLGDWRFHLVRKKPLMRGEDCVKGGDIIMCNDGADWFKAALVDMLNSDPEKSSKITAINISYENRGEIVAVTDDERGHIYYIAEPEEIAKLLRLELSATSIYNYWHQKSRRGAIKHEGNNAYQNWALANKSEAGIKDEDNDKLPIGGKFLEAFFGWQFDNPFLNGFLGDLEPDSAFRRPLTDVMREFNITPSRGNNWDFFQNMIFGNIPKKEEPRVGRGVVPNGSVCPRSAPTTSCRGCATTTFRWSKDFSPSDKTKESLRKAGAKFGENSVTVEVDKSNNLLPTLLSEILPHVIQVITTYAIETPHHPQEYDSEENAGAVYIGVPVRK